MNIIFHINLYLMYLIYFNIKKYFNFITAEYFQKQMIYFKRLIIFIRQSIYIDIIYLRMLHNIDRTNTLYPPVQISGCNHCRLNSSRCESSLRSTFPRRSSQKNRVVRNSNDAQTYVLRITFVPTTVCATNAVAK